MDVDTVIEYRGDIRTIAVPIEALPLETDGLTGVG